MPLANTTDRYGSIAKSFHWLTALLIVALIPMGIIANGLPYETSEELARKAFLFSLHKTLGVTVFFVALLRILWALAQPKPHPVSKDGALQNWLAQTVHWMLYGALLLVPLSGWIHHAATTGFAPIWWPFGQSLPFVPKNTDVADIFAGLHIVFERVLVLSIALHIAGALKHHFWDRDDTLRRMLPGNITATVVSAQPHSLLPPVSAVIAFSAAIGVGAALGAYAPHEHRLQADALAEVASDWQVSQGTLGIEVVQLGGRVIGSFSDWTAAITFDETADPDGVHGTVDVTVAIASLALGQVSGQAMGPDFFSAAEFPTAAFRATIHGASDGAYEARGVLRLKGVEMPLTLPFTLDLSDDGTAAVLGRTEVDRRDFGIGLQYEKESDLEFSVGITIDLNAQLTDPEI